MPTLLLRLTGPMQSWGSTSRFDQRDTTKEPTKSGVLGLLAAAMGIDRSNWNDLKPLTELKMGVRHDQPGILRRDFQTAQNIISADGKKVHNTAVTRRDYLADAAFLVGLEGVERALLVNVHEKLRNPTWCLGLGRKSYLPAEPVYLPDGISEFPLREALAKYPFLGRETVPHSVLFSFESADATGRMVMDQPLSSFAERRFGSRFVVSELLKILPEVAYAAT